MDVLTPATAEVLEKVAAWHLCCGPIVFMGLGQTNFLLGKFIATLFLTFPNVHSSSYSCFYMCFSAGTVLSTSLWPGSKGTRRAIRLFMAQGSHFCILIIHFFPTAQNCDSAGIAD